MIIAASFIYALIGLFVLRRVGQETYIYLVNRLADNGGSELLGDPAIGDNGPKYIIATSPWHYPRMYLKPAAMAMLWLPLLVGLAILCVVAALCWAIGKAYMKFLHPAVTWFFVPKINGDHGP